LNFKFYNLKNNQIIIKTMSNIELISASSYDTSRMIFSEPIEGGIPDSKPPISFKRVNISTVYENGSTGPLIMGTERLYSYGLGEDTNPDTGKINGYKLPLVLHNINGASQEEKDFVSTFESITKKCKDYLLKNKDKLEQYELEENDLKKLNPIYRKKEKGVVVETASPVLYAKLIVKKDKDGNKIITVFFDEDSGESINALDLLGKACYVRSAIKFESIFIGNKISLQIKLFECDVKVISSAGTRRLLQRRPQADSQVVTQTESKSVPMPLNVDDDDAGSLIEDDDEDEPAEVKEPPKKPVVVVRKPAKKVTKA
jgi:hypothetical protein